MGAFDDLIPGQGGGTFDDLIPAQKRAKPVGAAMVGPSPRIEDAPSLEAGPRTSALPDEGRPWGEVLSSGARNLLPSAGKAVLGSVNALTLGLPQTAAGLYDLGKGVVTKINRYQHVPGQTTMGPRPAIGGEETADAVGAHYATKYGTAEGFKNALADDPGSILMDAATLGTAGVALPGKLGQAAGVVSKLDPLTATGNALKYGAKGAEVAGSSVLGRTTGAGTESIRAAGRAGREGGENAAAFTENMRGAPVSEVADRARTALDQLRAERSAAYKGDMAKLGQDETVLNFDAIDGAVGKASQVGSFKGVSVEPAAQEIVTRMAKQIEDWKALDPAEYHTAVGVDALKRSLGNLRDSTGFNTPERVAADRIYNAVRAEITSQAPDYAKTMEAYGKASDTINEASRTFSLRENALTDTAARKLLSATRNNVQTNYGERGRLLNVLAEKDPTLPSAIAGQALNSLPPRGIVANAGAMAGAGMIAPSLLANPLNALTLAAFSPRIVGETVYAGGKIVGAVDDVAKALGITPARLRALGQAGYQAGRPEDIRQRAMSLRETNALAAP